MSQLYCLVEQEIPRLRRYARALTRASDRAEDLVQDTLLRALTKLHLWQPGTDIRAWLFTIMHHQYVNTVRREAREATTVVDIEHVSSNLVATTDPTARRQLAELDRALAQLSAEQRELMGRDREPQTGHSPDIEAPTTRPNTAVSLPKAA